MNLQNKYQISSTTKNIIKSRLRNDSQNRFSAHPEKVKSTHSQNKKGFARYTTKKEQKKHEQATQLQIVLPIRLFD